MLSATAEHAVRAVLLLARHDGHKALSADAIAAELGAPRNYLAKTLNALAKAGVVHSARGAAGGFTLAVPATELTLARIIAHELGAPFYQTSGPSLDKPGDLAGILAGLEPGRVLFIDEIHRLSIAVEEVLYSAMEDFHMDIVVGQGPTARSVRMPLNRFTMIGATTRVSLLSSPLLSRFGIQERLEFYSESSLQNILQRSDLKFMASPACDFEICVVCFAIASHRDVIVACGDTFCILFMHKRINKNVLESRYQQAPMREDSSLSGQRHRWRTIFQVQRLRRRTRSRGFA